MKAAGFHGLALRIRIGWTTENPDSVGMSDVFVSIEAATPGEVRAGMRVEWGIAESPFDLCSLGWNSRGICHLAFCDQASSLPDELQDKWPGAVFHRNDKAAKKWIRKIFVNEPADRIPVFVSGTGFQLKVWRTLSLIPRGSVATYSQIASAIGNPRAVRAVGTACGANPVAWLIPCHRVVRATGIAGGYRWGAERKKSMLAMDAGAGNKESGAGMLPVKRKGLHHNSWYDDL